MPDRSPTRPGADEARRAVENDADAAEKLTDSLAGFDGWYSAVMDAAYPIIAAAVLAEAEKRIKTKLQAVLVIPSSPSADDAVVGYNDAMIDAGALVAELRSELTNG